MSERFPGLGVDPAPGDPAAVDAVARVTGRLASHASSLADQLQALAEVGACWSGSAADEFGEAVQRLPRALRDTDDAFSSASIALAQWARLLGDLQNEARRAEQDAEVALARVRAASSEMAQAGLTTLGPPGVAIVGPVDPGLDSRVTAPFDEATRALEAARERGRMIARRAAAGSARAEAAVRAASRLAPPAPSAFQRIGETVGRFDEWLGEQVRAHAGAITLFADAMSCLGLLALLVGFPGGLVIGAAGLAATGLLARYAGGSPTDVALSVAGLATGGAAKAAGNLAKAARAEDLGVARDVPLSLWPSAAASPRQRAWQTTKLVIQLPELAMGVVGVRGIVNRYQTGDGTPAVPPRLTLVSAGAGCPEPGRSPAPRRVVLPSDPLRGGEGPPSGVSRRAAPPAPTLFGATLSGAALSETTLSGGPVPPLLHRAAPPASR